MAWNKVGNIGASVNGLHPAKVETAATGSTTGVAIGDMADASGENAIAIGTGAVASAANAVAFGTTNNNAYTIDFGDRVGINMGSPSLTKLKKGTALNCDLASQLIQMNYANVPKTTLAAQTVTTVSSSPVTNIALETASETNPNVLTGAPIILDVYGILRDGNILTSASVYKPSSSETLICIVKFYNPLSEKIELPAGFVKIGFPSIRNYFSD